MFLFYLFDSRGSTEGSVIAMAKGRGKFSRKNSMNLRNCKPGKLRLEKTHSFKNLVLDAASLPERPVRKLDAAAVKIQKVYKSYRTRRNLADCAVVVEELWFVGLPFCHFMWSSPN